MTKLGVVVSARSNSKRLPRKALLEIGGKPLIQFLIDRLRHEPLAHDLYFATTTRSDDDELARFVETLGVQVFRGADDDVVARHVALAEAHGLDWIARITGDCPFVDGASLKYCLAQWVTSGNEDLLSTKGIYPVGIDYEFCRVETLKREWERMDTSEREHLTLRIYRTDLGFTTRRFSKPSEWPSTPSTFTVDTPADYQRACKLVRRIGRADFSILELIHASVEMAQCAE